jgi:hypothetical protein
MDPVPFMIYSSENETDSGILSAAQLHLEDWSKSQIIKWVISNLDAITDSKEQP